MDIAIPARQLGRPRKAHVLQPRDIESESKLWLNKHSSKNFLISL
jgi:hypothetical protein